VIEQRTSNAGLMSVLVTSRNAKITVFVDHSSWPRLYNLQHVQFTHGGRSLLMWWLASLPIPWSNVNHPWWHGRSTTDGVFHQLLCVSSTEMPELMYTMVNMRSNKSETGLAKSKMEIQ